MTLKYHIILVVLFSVVIDGKQVSFTIAMSVLLMWCAILKVNASCCVVPT
jgi:hypothetical protein